MKKFLFTLAAVLMAGTAFAGRVYIPDTEFTADQIGTQVWLPVYIELDNEYMNGWDIVISYPENLVVTKSARKNNAVLNQTAVTDEWGTEETVSFSFNTTDEGSAYHTIGACISGGYWDPDGDGEYEMYGACKIGPTGTFMLYEVRVQPTAEFTGGNIEIVWSYSGGFDNRNGQTNVNVSGTTTVALTVEAPAEETYAPVPTFREADGKLYAEAEGHEVVLILNGEQVENPYTLPEATYEEQVLEFTAYTLKNDETYNSGEVTYTVTIDAKEKDYAPAPTFREADGKVYAEKDGYTVVLMLDGVEVENPYTLPEAIYGEAQTFNFTAYTVKKNEYYDSETVSYTATVAAKPYEELAGELVIGEVNQENGQFTVTYNGNEDVTITCDMEAVRAENTFALPDYGTYTVTAKATANNAAYNGDYVEATATLTWNAPAPEVTETPTITVVDDPETQTVTITVTGEGELVLYQDDVEVARGPSPLVYVVNYTDDPEGEELGFAATAQEPGKVVSDYARETVEVPGKPAVVVTPPAVPEITINMDDNNVYIGATLQDGATTTLYVVTYDEEGNEILTEVANPSSFPRGEENYEVKVKATATNEAGSATSEVVTVPVPAKPQPPTAVNELVDGKAVAGVRYFNMAGQEMKEANGVTIVVTTYTDGTTSAVKVIK